MTRFLTKRRLWLMAAAFSLLVLAGAVAGRVYLAGWAIGAALKSAGASEVRFEVAQATPWRVVVQDLAFLLRLQPFAAREVTMERAHWWTPSLGKVRVAQARATLPVDALAGKTPASAAAPAGGPGRLPIEEISIDGQLVLQAAGAPDQTLTVTLAAKPAAKDRWSGNMTVTAPGLAVKGEGSFNTTSGDLAFALPEIALDLKIWQGFLQRVVPLPPDEWELEGKFTGDISGRLVGGNFSAGGRLQLREGRGVSTAQAITAEGVEAEVEFIDFAQMTSKPGALRIRELRTGQLTLRDLRWRFALAGPDLVEVSEVTLETLGGRVSAEPFKLAPSRAELDAVLLVDGLDVEEVLALTKDLPAKATGRVNGRLPVRIARDGLKFGFGWLELKPGVRADVQFNAKGLLTGGASSSRPGYAVLQKVESGLQKVRLDELRLDIHPPNAPEGRSAQLHLKGEPEGAEIKMPITLDLNVNGPVEKLLNLGLDSRVSFGTGK
ncbi:MAG TPA: YdbH domain-containing protein [Lacunisphaera sp.]|nr:YdbH domain-containing protein [Lacunisphaera sp.]